MIAEGDICWTPGAARIEASEMQRFRRWVEQSHAISFDGYEDLWRWSVDRNADFWQALWHYFDILNDGPYRTVSSGEDMVSTRWFDGARVNFAEHLLRHEAAAGPEEAALRHSSEVRPLRSVGWRELGDAVRSVATALRDLGLKPGDRVASYMPNIAESAIAMLATAAVGGIWSAASPEFGAKSVVDRFGQIEPRIMFVADGYAFAGKRFDRRAEAAEIIRQIPSIEQVVFVPYLDPDASMAPKPFPGVPMVRWADLIARPAPPRGAFRFERVANDHPLWVLFSSGTTGIPKAIAHSHVGMVLDQSKQMRLHLDLSPGQSMFFYTTTGWMMWNSVMSALIAGATAVLYDGSPTWPTIDRLWDLAEQCEVTMFGVSPALITMMEEAGVRPGDRKLDRLDKIVLGGAPASPANFEWLHSAVKPDIWVMNSSGGTDLCGGLVGPVPFKPVRAGEMQGRMLGLSVEVWDDDGRPVVDEIGELVVTRPFPSQPLFFWGDAQDARYRDTYFGSYPGVWRHGDRIKITADGGCCIYGRSDATLNRFGVRIGTAEIYAIVDGIERVADSVVVNCRKADGTDFMPLFVCLRDNDVLDDDLRQQIGRDLRQKASPRHVPDEIVQAPALPYTLTGKKMEVPLRKILEGVPVEKAVTIDSVAKPAALRWFVDFATDRGLA